MTPGGQVKVFHLWPGQTPPGEATGRGDDYALAVLPLYYHAARLIGTRPDDLLQLVGQALSGEAQSVLLDFLGRSEHDKSLWAMGYRAGRDESGFRYEREW